MNKKIQNIKSTLGHTGLLLELYSSKGQIYLAFNTSYKSTSVRCVKCQIFGNWPHETPKNLSH